MHNDFLLQLPATDSCMLLPSYIFTRCAYAQGRVKRLSPSICMCVCVCVWRQKTRLFAVLPLENCHEIALYRSASQFIFFERCLESRTSLLSSAMAMGSNSCTAPRGIEHYGNWVCRPTTSLRERWRADRLAHGQ